MAYHRQRQTTTMAVILAALSSLLLILPVNTQSMKAGQYRRRDRVTNPSDEGDPYPSRVSISPFEITLRPTPDPLSETTANQILDVLQNTISNHVDEQQTLADGSSLVYVWLAGVSENTFVDGDNPSLRNLQPSDPQTVLSVSGGTATFQVEEGKTAPEASQVEGWVQAAVTDDLVPDLKKWSFEYVTTADFQAVTPAPSPPPIDPLVAGGLTREQTNPDDGDSDSRIVVGAVVGSVVAVGLLAAALLLNRRRRNENALKANDTYEMDEGQGEEFRDEPQNEHQDEPVPSVDARYAGDASSVASVSEWTASSSLTNKSGDTRPSVASPIGQTESFELDRQVMLRKDMLHTSPGWTDESPLRRRSDDTVLKPSYFSAKKERRLLREEAETQENQEFAPDQHWNPDDNKDDSHPPTEDSLFLFEANGGGEEMYIMPPSQTRGKRRVAANPEALTETSDTRTQLV